MTRPDRTTITHIAAGILITAGAALVWLPLALFAAGIWLIVLDSLAD